MTVARDELISITPEDQSQPGLRRKALCWFGIFAHRNANLACKLRGKGNPITLPPLQFCTITLEALFQCSQFGLACMANSNKALVSRLKPGFSAPLACLSLDSARLGIGSGLNKRDSASGQVLSLKCSQTYGGFTSTHYKNRVR